jgi:anti-sigma factor RsiW
MSCSQHDLKGYLLRELAAAEHRSVESHLEECPACREELERLQLTKTALRSLPDEEIPYRIAFVSDKIFEPRGWAWLWSSAPRLGFVSAVILAVTILVHTFARPAAGPSAAEMAAMEARIRSAVTQNVETELVPVVENLQMLQKKAAVLRLAYMEAGSRQ